jgi:hypothetical protein
MQVPPALAPRLKRADFEDAVVESVVKQLGADAKVIDDVEVKSGQFAGTEYLIELGGRRARVRAFLTPTHAVVLHVIGPRAGVESANATTFLSSYRSGGPQSDTTTARIPRPMPDDSPLPLIPGPAVGKTPPTTINPVPGTGPTLPPPLPKNGSTPPTTLKPDPEFTPMPRPGPKPSPGTTPPTTLKPDPQVTPRPGPGVRPGPGAEANPKAGSRGPRIQGGGRDEEFEDEAPEGGMLVGLEVGVGRFVNNPVIKSVRPIYRVGNKESKGEWHGPTGNDVVKETVRVVAKPGYAVGAVTVKNGLGLDGLVVTFMKIKDGKLDTEDAYESEYIGGTGGGRPVKIGGDGTPVTGLIGRSRADTASGLGLLYEGSKK